MLHDNAPIHTSTARLGFKVLLHSPYSPDLAPSDFYLFNKMKKHIRGKCFEDRWQLKNAVEEYLTQQTPAFYETAFNQLIERWKKCIACNGSYIEK